MSYIISFMLKSSTNFLNNTTITDKLPVLLHSQRQRFKLGLEGKMVYSGLTKKTGTSKNSHKTAAMLEELSAYNP